MTVNTFRARPMTDVDHIMQRRARLQVLSVHGRGQYGFAQQLDRLQDTRHVLIHVADLQAAGLPVPVAEGTVYLADVAATNKGLRAVNYVQEARA